MTRPTRIVTPTGSSFDIPAGPPVADADRTTLLARVNLIRSTSGNRTGFEALLGAGGMQKIRDRKISRQLQVYYAQLDEISELTAIVRGSPTYSAYLRTNREWTAVYLSTVNEQQQRALHLLGDIEKYLGRGGRRP